jgi:hypothetical protein
MFKRSKHRQKIIGNTRFIHNSYYTQKSEGATWGITVERYREIRTIDLYLGHTVQSYSIRKIQL